MHCRHVLLVIIPLQRIDNRNVSLFVMTTSHCGGNIYDRSQHGGKAETLSNEEQNWSLAHLANSVIWAKHSMVTLLRWTKGLKLLKMKLSMGVLDPVPASVAIISINIFSPSSLFFVVTAVMALFIPNDHNYSRERGVQKGWNFVHIGNGAFSGKVTIWLFICVVCQSAPQPSAKKWIVKKCCSSLDSSTMIRT